MSKSAWRGAALARRIETRHFFSQREYRQDAC